MWQCPLSHPELASDDDEPMEAANVESFLVWLCDKHEGHETSSTTSRVLKNISYDEPQSLQWYSNIGIGLPLWFLICFRLVAFQHASFGPRRRQKKRSADQQAPENTSVPTARNRARTIGTAEKIPISITACGANREWQ
jgi:hypothetical protein